MYPRKIIKRLIARQWCKAFLSSCFILFLLVSISDIVNELLRGVAPFPVILKHYMLEIPKWLNKIFPVSCLMASLFSLGKLQSTSELMAILSVGYPRRKIILTLLQLGLLISLVQLAMTGYLKPFAKSLRPTVLQGEEVHFRSNRSKGVTTSGLHAGLSWFKNSAYFASFGAYDSQNREFKKMGLYYFTEDKKIDQLINAKKATFLAGQSWVFHSGQVISSLSGEGFPVVENFVKRIVEMKEGPGDFQNINDDIEKLLLGDLFQYLQKIEKLGIKAERFWVELYQIPSDSLICLVFTLLAVGPIFAPNRRNSSWAKNLLFCFVFTLIYWVAQSSLSVLGGAGKLPPMVAVSIIPFLCCFYLMVYFLSRRHL